jgi:predicted nucleic acid-binding Zn ribbon protein
MQSDTLNEERRRKNVRVAWMLAAFALFLAVTSVPFWQGLFRLVTAYGQ